MAVVEYYIGTVGPLYIDDTDPLYAEMTQVALKQDVADSVIVGSDTITDETTFGLSPTAGTSDQFARGDHTHGTPNSTVVYRIVRTLTSITNNITVSDIALLCDTTSGAMTNTFPLANSVDAGHSIKGKKIDSSINIVSWIPTGTDTLNLGSIATELTLQNESISFISDGVSNWSTFN